MLYVLCFRDQKPAAVMDNDS
uniref:Uncharacterized protein n=1 Tax=Anguilla anguilla TaxID=7936 RepID=A0A0E9RC59_ANGAN